jgi:hypothetical protein
MGPQGPLLKNDGPICRVCGCSENNACTEIDDCARQRTRGDMIETVAYRGPVGCHWVRVEGSTPPLCSACSGTEADMAEAIARGCRMLQQHSNAGIAMALTIGKAALARRKRRQAENRT